MDIHPSCQKVLRLIFMSILIERTDNVAQAIFTGHFSKWLESNGSHRNLSCDNVTGSSIMNSQEALRRLANQLKTANSGGSPLPGGPKGFFAGSGLLILLIGGGLALNASLFNGTFVHASIDIVY